MKSLYNEQAKKKETNLNINLPATLEQVLKQKFAETKAEKWAGENKKAIKSYNAFVEENGCFGDEFRGF